MDIVIYYLEIITFFYLIKMIREVRRGNRAIKSLKELRAHTEEPKVTIVVAARNEERNLEKAIHSMLDQDYRALHVIAVDDRSDDDTGEILNRLAAKHSKLEVMHVTKLHKGWLGKNYALHHGAQKAQGDYLLFSDADVVMKPAVLSKAMGYLKGHDLDHLAVLPHVKMPNFWLQAIASYFVFSMNFFVRPWKVRMKDKKNSIGVGVFNLMTREAYDKIGGYEAIAMRPDDDRRLGELVKKKGLKQDFVNGVSAIEVEWYPSIKDLVQGLSRSEFAAHDYNIGKALLGAILIGWFFVFPYAGLVLTRGLSPIVNLLNVGLLSILFFDFSMHYNLPKWHVFAVPVGGAVQLYAAIYSIINTIRKKGIVWKKTHYDLKAMKENKL